MTFAPDLVLEPITRQLCAAFVSEPETGLLLTGEDGCGLMTLATAIAHHLNNDPESQMNITPEDGKDITIEQIRQLYHDTRSARDHHLSVVIDDADRMSIPAQNAFLKLLEEPPAQVVFILTTHAPQLLLPTIRSRIPVIEVRPLSRRASDELLTSYGITDPTHRAQLTFLAAGRPAGLLKLINDPDYFARRADTIRIARDIVTGTTYQRLLLFKDAMGDRETAFELVRTVGDVVTHAHKKSSNSASSEQMAVIADVIDNLHSNANVRLQLLSLALKL